jgi:TPP-dependent pyruvate/acetoin dehydrogenase alpha subunit
LPAPVADRAAGYGIPGVAVDGNDLDAVRRTVLSATARAREGKGPSLIEARTWRARGHWAADTEDYRTIRPDTPMPDPLARYGDRLIERGEASARDLDRLRDAARATVTSTLETVKALQDIGESELGLDEIHP